MRFDGEMRGGGEREAEELFWGGLAVEKNSLEG